MQVYLIIAAWYSLNREGKIVNLLDSNKIRSTMTLTINEIFYSIQGESTFAGLPFVFVRLTGCNLRCRYCDTRYAYEAGRPMEIGDVVAHVARFGCNRVTVTGGEPLLQTETPGLVSQLIEKGYDVSVETNGSLDVSGLDRRSVKVVDVKCPSSGMQHHNRLSNMDRLSRGDQIKFVITDRTDFDFALNIVEETAPSLPAGDVLFSPAHGQLGPDKLARWILEAKASVRLQIQLHKYIWPDVERGV